MGRLIHRGRHLMRIVIAGATGIGVAAMLVAPAFAADVSGNSNTTVAIAQGSYAPISYKSASVAPDGYVPPGGVGTTWPCNIYIIKATKSGSTMLAQSYTNCNGAYVSTSVNITAWHCDLSVFGACTHWTEKGQMSGGQCSNGFDYQLYCPSNGSATWGGIGSGQLWKVHANSCTLDVDGNSACGVAEAVVQF